ncbi:MAG TPA: helix-turn-helix transcriptional regulator [Tepidisphaeraceae bacterium]|nr:helix-turn-helix transcriptional regulator [Tepidisphaeraceae bacterium]
MKTQHKPPRIREPQSVTAGSNNIFEDLGFLKDQALDLKVKAGLTMRIHNRIKELGLTQVRVSDRLGISQPDVSKLMNGRHVGYSVERLLALLNALEVDVDIVLRPRHHGRKIQPGTVRVMEAAVA